MLDKTKTSIKWRIMLVFFVIVFIAMTVSGAFIINKLENYQIDSTRTNCIKTSDIVKLSIPFETYDSLQNNQDVIQAIVSEWQTGTDYEIYIVDSNLKIISADNTAEVDKSAIGRLDDGVIVKALEGQAAESQGYISKDIPVLNYAQPVQGQGGKTIGVLYLRANLTGVRDTTNEAQTIFLQAMSLALLISVVLSFLITSSITVPINDLTHKAENMALGDFSQDIDVRSADEIGRLAQMFNILRKELDNKIGEITNEKSKLETVLKYMADGVIAVDLDGTIIHMNTAARVFLDVTEEEAAELDFEGILKKLGKKDIADGIEATVSREVISEIITYNRYIFSVRYARFMDEDDNDIGVIMMIQDITEREELDQMQKDFVANVSHELRTPITTIKSYAETLIDGAGEDPDLRNSFLSVIEEEASRMTNLVKDLLQLSRLENKRERLNLQELDMNDILNRCAQKIVLTAQAKEQAVICDFDLNSQLNVMADRDRIQQVILNVLTNAIKYTPEGGTIRITSGIKGALVKVQVTDTGIGISSDEITRIFERFYRVDKARSRAMGGTGLGLSIAKNIVEAHGGSIYAESTEGVGTTVTILMPLTWSRGKRNIE